MTEKLDAFRPSKVLVAGVTRQLVNAGIAIESVPREWLEAILAGTLKYMTTTREGVEGMVQQLGFEIYRGDSEKEYVVISPDERTTVAVPPEDIWFLRGVVSQGRPVPFDQLSIAEKNRERCDDCGMMTHCYAVIRVSDTDKTLCNFCVTHHESPRISSKGDASTCGGCTVQNCTHHPARQTRAKA